MNTESFVLTSSMLLLTPCMVSAAAPVPPSAHKQPQLLEKHNISRTDDYYWLRNRGSKEVLDYLKAENSYSRKILSASSRTARKLFEEIKGRMQKDISGVPFKYGEYFYNTAYKKDKEYPVYRRHKNGGGKLETLLDVNEIAAGKKFCHVPFPEIRPDHKMIAYAVDTGGRRFYDIYFKDLETGKILNESIKNTTGNMVWAQDSRTLLYVVQDPETLRSNRVMAHVVGSAVEDKEIYYEPDETFEVSVAPSDTDRYVFIVSGASLTTEYRLLDAKNPLGEMKVFQPRKTGLEYDVFDGGDRFFVLNNDKAKNFRLSECPTDNTGMENWKDYIPPSEDTMLESADVYEKYLTVTERKDAQSRMRIYNRETGKDFYLEFNDPAYIVETGDNYEYSTDFLRIEYESMTTPATVYDVNMDTGELIMRKQQQVLGNFSPENYISERLWVPARDGVKIPVTIVYKKGLELYSGKNPLFQYAYGSYGYSSDPYFSSSRLSLLDRGFIYAIAHIRGGSEMGRQWYDDGKLLKKKNTFNDFIDVTKWFIENEYTSPEHIYAEGGSAGGLLMGVIVNEEPELYKGIIADVPFVDVVTTMLDEKLPLTTAEYDEWGNPNEKEYFEYMLSYSPYDNVKAQAYPNMYITTGLNDSQVQYWEPAKWTAKLRAMKTDSNIIVFETEMSSGHGGRSGRFDSLKQLASQFAFILRLEGIKE